MIYVTSDLHGLELSKFQALLKKANFSDNDQLYVLGDVVDRQNDGGVEILLWLLEQQNVELILGNHEEMLLSCNFVFNAPAPLNINNLSKEKRELLKNYSLSGGDVTIEALNKLNSRSSKTVSDIFNYLRKAPLYKTVTVGNKDFLLVHSGIDNFDENKNLSDYDSDDFLWAWPEITDKYFDNIMTVFGHTPTMNYDTKMTGKILRTTTWINIDVGIPNGNSPCLLRLDDLEEIYL